MINLFRGQYYFLSNYYECPVTYEGITYQNAEAAFQAQKVEAYEDKLRFKNLNPAAAKALGRKVDLRFDWEIVKDRYMYEIVKTKFVQNQFLKEKLIKTAPHELIEGTTGWHDNIWGSCECPKCKNIKSLNKLGKILMKVRQEFLNESISIDRN